MIGVGGDLANRLGHGAMRITGGGIWGESPDGRWRRPEPSCWLI
jgi:hypothetical protein